MLDDIGPLEHGRVRDVLACGRVRWVMARDAHRRQGVAGVAEIVPVLLRAQGVACGLVSDATRAPQRRRTIDAFRRGELRVLCNCEVLTTGFDAPQVTHVVIARPTVSHVLFEQMVGRGLRGPQFGGNEHCHVLYFVDQLDIDNVRLGFNAWRRIWGLD